MRGGRGGRKDSLISRGGRGEGGRGEGGLNQKEPTKDPGEDLIEYYIPNDDKLKETISRDFLHHVQNDDKPQETISRKFSRSC